MDEKQQQHLDQLKDFSTLVQDAAALEDTPEISIEDRFFLEVKRNKLLDMATELSYVFPKDTHDLWKQYMPESEAVPPILQKAYDRLTDEQKAATESVLQASADQEARIANMHKILFRAIERMEEKYPPKASMPGYSEEEAQGALYVEIRDVFEKRDYVIDAPERQIPSLEDALALTKFLERHNDPAQRAELERLAEAHQQRAEDSRELAQMDFDFGNVVEPEPQRTQFESMAELIEHLTPLAKDGQLMAAPRDTVLYLDGETNALTLVAISEAAAGELSNEMGGNGTETEYAGNRITFRSTEFAQVSDALAKLKLEDKDRSTLRSIVRQILNKRIPDISDVTMQRAREMRQARLIELAKLAQKEATTAAQQPDVAPRSTDNDVGNAEVVPGADTVKAVPPQVERAYVRIPDRKGDRFYLNNRLDTVAFVDKGAKLETKSDNEKTALDMVSIAEARGWESIKVSGTEAFRQQVWLEASARGISVRGYKPNEMDKALLAKRTEQIDKNGPNSIEQADERARPAAKDASTAKSQPEATAAAAAPVPTNAKSANNLSGVLIEHGKAPFEFDNDNKPNYYVKYRDEHGTERITWGLDLERAIVKSEAQPGDKITLENLGKKAVEVEANVKDDNGKVVGTKTITTHRNSWNVEVARDFLEMPAQEFAAKHPSQVNAAIINAFTSKAIAEYPKFDALSATDKERLRSGVETKIAEAIEEGKTLPALSVVKRTRMPEVVPEVVRGTSRTR